MPEPTPADGEDELRALVYHKLDHLAEGAHRAFNDAEVYTGWIDQYTDEIMQLIAQSNQQAVQKALEGLLEEGNTCVCQLADVAVCDHNWSLCNEIRDRLAELTAAKTNKDERSKQ